MRSLVSIQIIKDIIEIPKANNIELVTFKSIAWQCVAKKGEFKPGDFCVYFEIDSLLPKENPVFAFMEARKFRVKTVKFMKDYLSQGLALPVSSFPGFTEVTEGLDITEFLKVTKYENDGGDDESEEAQSANRKNYGKFRKLLMKYKIGRFIVRNFIGDKPSGNFPTHLASVTDETRIQNLTKLFELAKGKKFTYTEKLDGQSGTYIFENKSFWRSNFYVCSREKCYPTRISNNFWYIADKYNLKGMLENICKRNGWKSIVFQGEIVGPKVQKNIYKLEDLEYYVFNIIITTKNNVKTKLNNDQVKDFIDNCFYANKVITTTVPEVKTVPLLGTFILGETEGFRTVEEMLKTADAQSVLYPTAREGFVCRDELMMYSFKAVSNEYLLQKG